MNSEAIFQFISDVEVRSLKYDSVKKTALFNERELTRRMIGFVVILTEP